MAWLRIPITGNSSKLVEIHTTVVQQHCFLLCMQLSCNTATPLHATILDTANSSTCSYPVTLLLLYMQLSCNTSNSFNCNCPATLPYLYTNANVLSPIPYPPSPIPYSYFLSNIP
eukprot:972633-Amorphochlora_amoeboformis.AAC.1